MRVGGFAAFGLARDRSVSCSSWVWANASRLT
jgi:hypothetical protein